jgi:DNA invertase Pin-like site-specific DNA recombinase
MGTAKRVGFYLRVSTSGQTVENQRMDLQRVAEQRGWHIAGEYIDHGISGTKGREKRPGLASLARDAAQGKLDMVASWSIDRVGRSLGHLVEIMDELRQQGVGLYLHQQQVDTSTAAGRAFLQMAGVFAEFERSLIVERIKAGLARAKSSGKRLGRKRVSSRIELQIRNARKQNPTLGMIKISRKVGCGVGTVQRVLGS